MVLKRHISGGVKMVIVNIVGGLGNQMFCYAFGKSLEQKYDFKIFYDIRGYKSYFRAYDLDKFDIKNIHILEDKNKIEKYNFIFSDDMFSKIKRRVNGALRINRNYIAELTNENKLNRLLRGGG